ncbi:hypothetical protein RA28_05445 [Ruegeria sp. ANG-S4]|uniref:hypothetical protein n=1 Tax=Ruegeria sp. ANG-S4 TaxID=1577904 RepID=UPI00057FF36C|nr:hypothetical protein [Ruegeria sp. ANG-S4]KIC47134.1 hypothetical protein RA28_05445 [Ruegeria sp. ANG-S4]
MKWFLMSVAAFTLVACAPPPPTSPAEKAARSAAAFEFTATRCTQHAGGYSDAVALQKEAQSRYATARKLGATEQQIAEQKKIAVNALSSAEFLAGSNEACKSLVSHAAKAAAQS